MTADAELAEHDVSLQAEDVAKLRALRAEEVALWRALGCPPAPPRPEFCAECVRSSDDLRVRLVASGRLVWLCPAHEGMGGGRP